MYKALFSLILFTDQLIVVSRTQIFESMCIHIIVPSIGLKKKIFMMGKETQDPNVFAPVFFHKDDR